MPLVLIVDDNDRNRKLAGDILIGNGFKTLEAASGGEALALALEHLPDIVLMDLRLPDMDGVEAARRLKDDIRTARIPLVVLSALPLEGNDDWLVAGGFAGRLEKPIQVGTFAEQVRGYCPEPST